MDGGKVPPVEDVRVEDAEPGVDRVEPTTVLGRRDEADAMVGIAEVGLPALHALEDAPSAFFTEDLLITKGLGDEAYQGLARVSRELITQEDKTSRGIGRDASRDRFDTVSFGSGIGTRWGDAFPSGQVEIASHDLGAMTDVVELPAFDVAWLRGQGLAVPFKGLSPGFLIDTHHVDALGIVGFRFPMQLAERCHLFGKHLPISHGGMFPLPASVRLEDGVLVKNARCGQGRWP